MSTRGTVRERGAHPGWSVVRARRWLLAAVLLTSAVHVADLVPGVRTSGGYLLLPDAWTDTLCWAGAAVVLVLRGLDEREERAAWCWLGGAVAVYLAGNLGYYLFYQHLDPVPFPSWSDLGWTLFYPLAYTGVVLLVRARGVRLAPSAVLDGLVGGLTAAAFTAAFLLGDVLVLGGEHWDLVLISFAYPVADLVLLVLVVGVLTVTGRGAGAAWWLLSAGMLVFVLTDVVYAYQLAAGSVVDGKWLDAGWLVALDCLVLAAGRVAPHRPVQRREGLHVLLVPAVCAVAALGLLFYGGLTPLPLLGQVLALSAVLAALGRTALTFREEQALAESRRQARTDDLTGLANRRRFYEVLHELDPLRDTTTAQVARAAPGSGGPAVPVPVSGQQVAVLLVDLDRFKEINDSLGHHAGDEVLRAVGPRLSTELAPGALLARLGGDEFAVLAPGLDGAGAVTLAQRLLTALRRPFVLGDLTLTLDASVGIALAPDQASSGEELLQLADLAMYAAKTRRAGVLVYDPVRDGQGRHRLETVEQLRAGLERGELVLHYQPKLDLRTHRITGVEALARWQHPTRGLLRPDAFVDLAESSGLMARLTLTVLDQALAQLARWRSGDQDVRHPPAAAQARAGLTTAVNVSPSNLVDARFPAQVEALLAVHGVPACALVLEVTESLLMEDRDRAVSVLTHLRAAGVGIAIDDYGTGYSSLAYLAELPVTELKLDRAFVATMSTSARNRAIVTSTIQLAHALGLLLVAEGVEDGVTLDLLAEHGCDTAQGYHIGRPVTADALTALLAPRHAVTLS